MNPTRRDVLAGLAATSLTGSGAQAAPRWIDVHMHVVGGPRQQFGEAVERAVEHMDRLGVAKAVIFPPPLSRPKFDYPDYLPELRRYPGRFGFLGGGGTLNPMLHRFANPASVTPNVLRQFRDSAERTADAGAAGYGEIAILHLSLTRNHPSSRRPRTTPSCWRWRRSPASGAWPSTSTWTRSWAARRWPYRPASRCRRTRRR